MKKTYKIEVEASKIKGIKSVSVNFITQKMEIEFLDDVDDKKLLKEVIKKCKKVEPDFEIYI